MEDNRGIGYPDNLGHIFLVDLGISYILRRGDKN
jgi:hypothetical protein